MQLAPVFGVEVAIGPLEAQEPAQALAEHLIQVGLVVPRQVETGLGDLLQVFPAG